jgi:hypothetical protein
MDWILLHSVERGTLRIHDRRFSEAMTDKQLVLDTTGPGGVRDVSVIPSQRRSRGVVFALAEKIR